MDFSNEAALENIQRDCDGREQPHHYLRRHLAKA
jgi:hypothetical protein